MKHIKSLRLFENTQELTKDQINFLDHYTNGTWSHNPSTGLIDIKGGFDCRGAALEGFKGIKFGEVTGDFFCSNNYINSLEGAPKEVGQGFSCHNNYLTSLEGAPKKVGQGFFCSSNYLTSLEGSPQEFGGYFDCKHNRLISLEGAPKEVDESFYCSSNSLTSLKGAPEKVGRGFYCNDNPLTSLEGAPEKVGGDFKCDFFSIPRGEWNVRGWLIWLIADNKKTTRLISTLPKFPEELNKEIEKNPGKWVMYLKRFWNLEEFRSIRDQLKVSDQFLKDIGAQSSLSDLGF